jgi:hypothetical protein
MDKTDRNSAEDFCHPPGAVCTDMSHPTTMNDFCDLLGTPDAPVSKIASVKAQGRRLVSF